MNCRSLLLPLLPVGLSPVPAGGQDEKGNQQGEPEEVVAHAVD